MSTDIIEGVMGGVNGNRNYATTMGFGYFDDATGIVQVTKPLLQGGIVSRTHTRTRTHPEHVD